MIKNYIFDFGKVIVHFDTEYMVKRYVNNTDDARILGDVIFDRLYWDKLDAGTISDEEVIAESKKRLPERLHCLVEQIYYDWILNIPEIEGMTDLVKRIKREKGAPVYLLSNISTYFANHTDRVPSIALFDRCFFSAVCGMTKPSKEIFEYVCRECGILPSETLFIDDSPKNIEGARAAGLHTYLFDGNAQKLEAFIFSTTSPVGGAGARAGLEASPFTP